MLIQNDDQMLIIIFFNKRIDCWIKNDPSTSTNHQNPSSFISFFENQYFCLFLFFRSILVTKINRFGCQKRSKIDQKWVPKSDQFLERFLDRFWSILDPFLEPFGTLLGTLLDPWRLSRLPWSQLGRQLGQPKSRLRSQVLIYASQVLIWGPFWTILAPFVIIWGSIFYDFKPKIKDLR